MRTRLRNFLWMIRRRWYINGAVMANTDKNHWLPDEKELDTAEMVIRKAEKDFEKLHPRPV